MKKIVITADYNDGDYDTEETNATEELINITKKVCSIIQQDKAWGKNDQKELYNNPSRWVEKGLLTQNEVDTFDNMCPNGEGGYGIHTIESVQIVEVLEKLI